MSRSYRKSHKGLVFHSITVSGFTKGIKKDKQENNRRLRRKANILLRYYDDNTIIPTRLEEVMERWSYADDGRTYSVVKDILEYDRPWEYLRK